MKKISKAGLIYFCAAIIILLPLHKGLEASYPLKKTAQLSYPLPIEKPLNIHSSKGEKIDTHLSEKQAIIAALGLYLGVNKAIIPIKK